MDRLIAPVTTTADMVRAEPDEAELRTHQLPSPVAYFKPRGIRGEISICGGSSRTRHLIESIYGSVRESKVHAAPIQAPTLLITEGDYLPRFTVDRVSEIISISGPIITVAQLKISIRYLTACAALRKTTSLTPIHGCLVSRDFSNLLVCGPSGIGKTRMSEDLVKEAGSLFVEDWALYDTVSRLCMFEDERRMLRRGGDPPPTFPPWMLIEKFNGDPRSTQSRYLLLYPEAEANVPHDVRVTHLLILDDPYAAKVALSPQDNVGILMEDAQPRFTDEALSILGMPESGILRERLNVFSSTLDSRRLIGHRTSAAHYQQSLSLVNSWIDGDA
jgi:hypothetical protein